MDDLVGSYLDRFGNTVVLSKRQWHVHVVPKHPDMETLLWCIAHVLSAPTLVTRDTAFSTTRCFYRRGLVPGMFVKVVADYPPDNPASQLFTPVVGTMLTAFLATRVKQKEQRLWP